ncbi:S41 family peptidase [Chryseolinea sp. H1M3-3]|uniref:S41 family peptidase n=1 Tax=Chryseolinea sp. H1M3-3 TaxID=3034144 RepID=UPI0023EAE2E0|nr:S41 family peptidase [Chryseolinea sp. H1M3-3]
MWRRKNKWLVVIFIFLVTALAFRKPAEKYFDIAKSLDIFATLFKEVNAYYVDEVEPRKLIRHGIEGMLESLDPYTDYIPEDELESFQISTTGQYGGIGALIGIVNKRIVVTHPYKNFPAYKAGIKVGDEIIAVNGKSIQGKTPAEISALLKGAPKTNLEIKIKRSGTSETTTYQISREKISITNLSFSGLVEPGVGYIRLDDFTPGAAREVSDAVIALKQKGASKIILDLRNNPGGLLHEAVNIVSLFVEKGQEVVSTKGKVEEWNKTYKTLNQPIDKKMGIVVLVGEGSASASEIVAGALQDYDRAVLIGQRTFGKGLVQTTRPLAYNSQLKVTTAKYYIPSGRCIQALDYTHRKQDGTVERIADSLKVEFKTKRGRKVFDGGGLDPDIKIDDEYVAITSALINEGLVFDFASRYCAENPTIPELKSFQLTEKDFNDFIMFVKNQQFAYTTPLEDDIEKLMETAKKERYDELLNSELNGLLNKVQSSKSSDIKKYKPEIMEVLREQIGFHYNLYEGQAEVSLQHDAAILEGRKILKDSVTYNKLLSVN